MKDPITWQKKDWKMLSEWFSTHGLTCPCSYLSCQTQTIQPELLEKLDEMRNELNAPILVSSGYRCHAHQEDLASLGYETAKGISQHELGWAADLVAEDMGKLLMLCDEKFQSIGVSRRFIHVDLRADKLRR